MRTNKRMLETFKESLEARGTSKVKRQFGGEP